MNSIKRDTTNRWLLKYTKNGELTINKSELARRMMAGESGMFPSFDNARSWIRKVTGSYGDFHREIDKSVGRKPSVGQSSIMEGLRKSGMTSHLRERKIFRLPPGKYLVMNDVHIPFHHEEALGAAIQHGLDNEVTGVILNGDIMDCYDISRFMKERGRPSIREEFDQTRAFLKYLRSLFPTQLIYYKMGNHEERMRHYILRNARELSNMDELEIHQLLNFKELNITRVDREVIKAGKLNILHGHEIQTGFIAPVNPARGMFLRAKSSTIFGHQHQKSTHRENNLNGDTIIVHSIGCLCDLNPEYMPYGDLKWVHGAAIVSVEKGGNFNVENFEIINGQIYH